MPTLTILTTEEQAEFESPPNFIDAQRRTFFILSDEVQQVLRRLQGKTNKVCFLIQLAYFKACQQFFDTRYFSIDDIGYVARLLGYENDDDINIDYYKCIKTIRNHRQRILKLLGYRPYDKHAKAWLSLEAENHVKKQFSPKKILLLLLKFLQQQRIVFPTYHALSKLIGDAYLAQEVHFLSIVKQVLPKAVQISLDKLLLVDQRTKQTPIRQFKVINQSTKPKSIQASLTIFNQIKLHFDAIEDTLNRLNLHDDCARYYATWIRKAKLSQLQQFPDKYNLYLQLMAFIKHQIYYRHDYFVDILLKSVQTAKNLAANKCIYSAAI